MVVGIGGEIVKLISSQIFFAKFPQDHARWPLRRAKMYSQLRMLGQLMIFNESIYLICMY